MMFAINVPSLNGRYLSWCDDHWYGTTRERLYCFCGEEIDTIVEQMLNHYIYHVVIEGQDGVKMPIRYKSKFEKDSLKAFAKRFFNENDSQEGKPVQNNMTWAIPK